MNWTIFNTANSDLPDNYIGSLTSDANGNIWIGTLGSGLARFDGINWTVYNTGNSGLPHNSIVALNNDSGGNIWIGTGSGIVRFNGDNWSVYNISNSGLPDNNVWSLTLDTHGHKWIGTTGGLAVFREGGVSDDLVAIEDEPPAPAANTTGLALNYPNPFAAHTTIRFQLPARQAVSLQIYNTAGQLVRTLIQAPYAPGEHAVAWDGRNEQGQPVGSGVYFYRLQAGAHTETRKMALLR